MIPNKLYLADDLAAMPTTRADREQERADFIEACRRAEAKGNRALELLRSRECNPWLNPAIQKAKESDYDVRAK